ncbi:MAG: hypothetical protein AB1449_01680 [Chloroflexota bacterium]
MPDTAAIDLAGTLIAGLLTVMVLSYVLGDNVLFRLAVHLFIGVAAGYAGALALRSVLWPRLVVPLITGGAAAPTNTMILSWVLVLMLVLKLWPGTARWGSLPMALLVGVGAALVVGGAITGTLIPQSLAAMDTLDPRAVTPVTQETGAERVANVLVLLIGTLSTLIYFRFTARRSPTGEAMRSPLMTGVAYVGRGFIALTFGVMYAGALAAALTVLAERVQFLIGIFAGLLAG